ncbi:MAG: ribonuclease P protein component [Anaerolineaceae bacterium]|nr:ribonuclease P protein component [Anaerolineaceae bacterium]MCD6474936.1 ribonuclease P protein component [Anaerolineaceae bacterium]
MKREFRLRKTKDIQRLRSDGKAYSNRYIVLLVKEQPSEGLASGESHSRVGVITGKRIGNAVTRNKVKRRIQYAIEQHFAELPEDWDFLFLARKPIVKAKYQEIEIAVLTLLRRAGILDGKNVQPR